VTEGQGVLQVSIPALEAGLAAYYILAMSEASSNLSRYDGIRYGQRTQVWSYTLSMFAVRAYGCA
jgi:aspartyl-tRNA(Asn)/glutamyl-tRNA(Gln) amidotransferase subunit A